MSTIVSIEIPSLTINIENVGDNSLVGSFIASILEQGVNLSGLPILKIGKIEFFIQNVMEDVLIQTEINKLKSFIGSGIQEKNIIINIAND